jgi:hypothetical protein
LLIGRLGLREGALIGFRKYRDIQRTRAAAGIVIVVVGAIAFFSLPLEGSPSLPPALFILGVGRQR